MLIAVNVVAALFSMIDLNLLDRIESGELVGDDEIDAHDTRMAAVGLLQTVASSIASRSAPRSSRTPSTTCGPSTSGTSCPTRGTSRTR
ncbi:MAG TPA: hypothetical protein VK631_22320 [Solirubrobacteraceae bacterium]|nr:hypothetical protein [Solirubrobacteraceae bacterium]